MTLRCQGAMGERETRTRGALVAALRARPRTPYRAVQCVLAAKASIFNSLIDQSSARNGLAASPHRSRAMMPRMTLRPPSAPTSYDMMPRSIISSGVSFV